VQPLILPGRINSLAQTLLKLTAPGIPDLYQGTELWDLSLVDPDNRRPVDYTLRRRLLHKESDCVLKAAAIMAEDGWVKLRLIMKTIALRRRFPNSFGPDGAYRPLLARGNRRTNVVAFVRGESCLTIVPRWWHSLRGDWADTSIELPAGCWRNELTGEELNGGTAQLSDLLAQFPAALLLRSGS
jgi:(1->4)-alpha-D-glucan 1-alpha-D-glucosylmutase